MFNIEYALDTYSVFNFNGDQVYDQFAMSGRFITAIVGKFVKVAGFSEKTIYLGSFILALICAFMSQFIIYKIVKKYIKNKVMRVLIPIFIIINPFSIEFFLFIEKGIMWFGVLMAVCAAQLTIRYFETKKKRNIVYAMIFMLLSNFSYQGVIGIFVVLSLVYILKYSKKINEFIKNNLIVAFIYGVPAAIDYILIKILYQGNRLSGQTIIGESILKIFNGTSQMISGTYEILPKFLFLGCVGIIISCIWWHIYRNKKQQTKEILKIFYIFFGTIIIAIAPQFMQPTASIWFVPRSTYVFGSLYGILILYLYSNFDIGKIVSAIIVLTSITLIIFQYSKFTTIVNDRYRLNKIDYEISMQIVDKIKSYEQLTQKNITKLQIYADKIPKFTYDEIFSTRDTNIKAYGTDWSTEAVLEYYLKRDLQLEKQNYELKQAFLEKNWNEFDIENQVLLKDDTLIICRY